MVQRSLALWPALLALLATACSTSTSHVTPAPEVVLVGPGAAVPSALNLQSNLFVEGGFGQRNGMTVSLRTAPGPQSLAALESGQSEFVLTNPATVFNAVEAGASVRIVAAYSLTFPTAIVARAEIGSVAELAGRTVAVSSLGDVPQIYTNAYLSGSGLVDAKAVKYAGAGNYANAIAYLTSGQADAAWVLAPNLPALLKKNSGLHVLVPPEEFAVHAPSAGTVLVVKGGADRARVQKVVDMVISGTRVLYDDEATYVSLMRQVLPGVYTVEEATAQYRQLRPSLAVNGGLTKSVLEQSIALWRRYSAPRGAGLAEVSSVVDPSFVADAIARLGVRGDVSDLGDMRG